MAGTIAADTLTHSTAGSLTTDYVVNGSAKAWLHLNGTATFDASDTEIKDSFNITTTVDAGTGNYSWSFINVFTSADFSEALTSHQDETRLGTSDRASSASGVRVQGSSGSVADSGWVQAVEHGDLA